MTGREWKPGDVAMVTLDGRERVAVRGEGIFCGLWYVGGPERGSQHGWTDTQVTDARPLVVIDLSADAAVPHATGRTEAERLVSMLRETADDFFAPDAAELARRVADQIEGQARPPKPEEPTGLGAVVEDHRDMRFVRCVDGWLYTGGPLEVGEYRNPLTWSDLRGVRVLSEGMQP